MQKLNWDDCIRALTLIMEAPNAEKGYEDLKKYFFSNNLKNEYEAIDFLLKEKFNVDNPNIDKK